MDRVDVIYRHPKLLIMVNVSIVVLLMLFLLFFARDVLSSVLRKPARPAPVAQAEPRKAKGGIQEYAGIFARNPFGFPAGRLKELSGSKEGGVSTSDLSLVGTIAGAPQYSYAIVADKSGKQEIFRMGESVFGSGKLKKVEKDRVIVSDGGREMSIPMAEMLTIKDVTPHGAGAGSTDFAKRAGASTFIVDQQKVLDALEHPNQLMTDARLQPNISDGKQEGYILREVRNGGIYQSLGLQNGDVLLRINDYNISNPENALQAFTALRGMDRVQVDLVRGGSRMTMTYQIR
ncbi:MAG: hypothetical protein M1497_02900 [Nitrospirae bacterium]|nr:hypothetical protein [Nitrospirota bacterium]